ncbi:MAG TPA: hypothetical protein VMR21_00055, partial [Vicinamibacteria bacterium]|nr:hypothetical protein [Vicinamibacteria bacterium]
CRRQGVRPVFVALPRRRRAGEPAHDSPYPGLQRRAARELDVPLVTVPELDAGQGGPANEDYFVDTLHLSPAGNALMGGAIAEVLMELGLL